MNRTFAGSLAAIFALLGLAALRYRPPPPGPPALRARAAWQRALGEETPHPVGSAHDAEIRDRLIAQLRELGYRPEVIEGSSCGSSRACGRTRSIVARREGREAGPAIWFNCHYDSVWAGPAVSDDGAGVSAGLEIAHALAQEPPHRRAIALLFNEGEEPGLLGAELLVRHKEFLDDVAAIVNLEARGTGGPSLMFETSAGNADLIDLYAKAIGRPMSNSLYYAIYKQLPNDTDLTVFKRAGLAGYGFAFIGGTARYHTPLDDLAHGDLGSVQHQTENALALVRALADTGDTMMAPRAPIMSPTRDAFFFDVFALFVVRGSLLLTRLLAVLAAVAVFLALRGMRPKLLHALSFVLSVVLSAAIAAGLLALLHPPYPWLAQSTPIRALFICLPLAVCALVRMLWPTSAKLEDRWAGAWAILALVGLVLAAIAPEVSYVVVLPALVAGIFGIAAAHRRTWWAAAVAAPAIAAAILLLPIAWLLYDAMGTVLLPVSAAVFAILFALVFPAAEKIFARAVTIPASVVSLLIAIAAAFAPPFSPDNPKHENLVLLADEGKAQWIVEGPSSLEPSFRAAAQFSEKPGAPLSWLPRYKAFVAPAPSPGLDAPRLDGVRVEGKLLRATLVSPRGAPRAGVVAPESRVRAIRFDGQAPAELTSKNRIAMSPLAMPGMINLRWETMTAEGVPVEMDLEGDGPFEIVVWDQSPGVPAEGKALLAARPPEACPVQDGDRTLVVRNVRVGR